jgi:hypothetical protein
VINIFWHDRSLPRIPGTTRGSGAVAEIGEALGQESDLVEGHAASVAGRRLALEADLVA